MARVESEISTNLQVVGEPIKEVKSTLMMFSFLLVDSAIFRTT